MKLTSEMESKLELYVELLKKWNQTINLVSRETIADVWNRHIVDCLQLVEVIPAGKTIVDLGSGAGLPGIILAICLDVPVTLVERDQRKCAFLREAVRQLALTKVTVFSQDLAELSSQYDVVTARALASLDALCAYAYPLMKPETICYFPKGQNFASEVAVAELTWQFKTTEFQSKTNDLSVILCLNDLRQRA